MGARFFRQTGAPTEGRPLQLGELKFASEATNAPEPASECPEPQVGALLPVLYSEQVGKLLRSVSEEIMKVLKLRILLLSISLLFSVAATALPRRV